MNASRILRACGLVCSIVTPALADEPQTIHDTYVAPNGHVFAMTKTVGGGVEEVRYERGGQVYDRAGLADHIRRNPMAKIEESLLAEARGMAPDAPMIVNVVLKTQPREKIAREVWRRITPDLEALSADTLRIQAHLLLPRTMTKEEERQFMQEQASGMRPGLTAEQRAAIRANGELVEAIQADARAEINNRCRAIVDGEHKQLDQVIAALGGRVIDHLWSLSGATVSVPAGQVPALSAQGIVRRVFNFPDVTPELNLQKTSLGTSTVHAAGVDGGIWDPALLDSGVDQAHPAFNGATPISFLEAPGVGLDDTETHGTAVCGILVSQDATNTGMAPGCDTIYVGYFARPDVMGDADWMVSSGDPENINISAGYGTANDVDYSDVDRFFDWVVDVENVPVSKSTGNNFDGTTTITHPAPAYNLIAVANMNDRNTTSRADDIIDSSSSRGPTLSGRRKPDMAAPGTNTQTCSSLWEGAAADFTSTFGGTSAASPHVGGTVILLTDATSNDNPLRHKAVIINNADTWTHGSDATSNDTSDDGPASGTQWNKVYGWGYLDVLSAYTHRADVFVDQVDDGVTPLGPDYKFYKGTMTANEKATLVWKRHITFDYVNGDIDNPPAIPAENFTDLDLFVYRQGDGVEIMRSFTTSSNVEQVAVSAAETVVLKVDCFTANIDPQVGIEDFALATQEGFVAATGPALTTASNVPDVSPGQDFTFTVTVNNTGDLPAHGVTVDLALPAGYTIVSGADPQNLGSIANGANDTATWRLRAPCNTDAANIVWTTSSVSYAETFTAPAGLRVVTPGVTALTSNVVASDTAVEKTFSFAMIAQTAGGDWYVVALNPGATDRDVLADDDQCMASAYQQSAGAGTTKDFTMTNSHLYAPGAVGVTHYASIIEGAEGAYSVEMNASDDMSVNATTGGTRNDLFAVGEIADCVEALGMQIGRRYQVTVNVTSGTCDPSLWMYVPSRTDGDRFNANRSRNTAGAGGDESMIIGPLTEAGFYGFAIINENAAAGNYTFSITPICVADVDDGSGTGTPDGGVTIDDLLYYLSVFEAGLIAADVDDGSGTGTPDGGVTIDDLLYYLARFEAGC